LLVQATPKLIPAAACLDPIEPQTARQIRKEAIAKQLNKGKAQPVAKPLVQAVKDRAQKVLADVKVIPVNDKTATDDGDSGDVTKSAHGAAGPAVTAEKFDTGSDMMDGILEHSRSRVIEEIERLNQRVESLFHGTEGERAAEVKAAPRKGSPGLGGVIGLQKRVEALEMDQGKLLEEATGLRTGLQKWNEEVTKTHVSSSAR
jgi:hypothetical protein